jgi:hypothetical protein
MEKMREGAIVLGMRRSGSTLAFNLVRELLTKELENGILRTTYADGDAADRFVETARLTSSAFVLKTHASGPLVDTLIAAGRVGSIYTWRDPRDAIVSQMNFLKSTFTEAMDMVTTSLFQFEQSWSRYCLEIPYLELYPLTSTLIYNIANYLDIPCSGELVNRLINQYCQRQCAILRAGLQISRMNLIFAIWIARYRARNCGTRRMYKTVKISYGSKI